MSLMSLTAVELGRKIKEKEVTVEEAVTAALDAIEKREAQVHSFGVFVDDLSYAVGILLNMLMFLSGIFYEVNTTLPEPFNIVMMYCNPIAIVIDTMRNALLYNYAANLLQIGIWFLIGIVLSIIGIHIVYKNENAYVKVV